jgi:LysM repeat protein
MALKAVSQSPASTTTQQYIARYHSIAEEEMQRTGVPAAISLAQGIIESQSGTGWLVEHSHNHFGIKCKSDWKGETIHHDDDRKNECFRVYQTDDSSWRDHSDFLKNTPRYSFLFYLDPTDYKAWAYGLKKAGYATSNRYARQLIQTIETYHLEKYTTVAMAGMKNAPSRDFADMLEKKVDQDRQQMGEVPPVKAAPVAKATASPYPAGPFQINGLRVVYLQEGTPLIGVAAKNHIRLSKLIRDNELPGSVLGKDMLVFLEKKKKTGARETHTVDTGETLHEIAQTEGIRLKWLLRRNRISSGDEPAPGSILYLKGYAPEPGSVETVAADTHGRGFFYKLTHLFSGHQASAGPQTPSVVSSASQSDEPAPGTAAAPVKDQQGTPRAIYKPEGQATGKSFTYKVQQGDTLYGISRKYGVTVAQIQAWNNLTGNDIRIGQELTLKDKQQ